MVKNSFSLLLLAFGFTLPSYAMCISLDYYTSIKTFEICCIVSVRVSSFARFDDSYTGTTCLKLCSTFIPSLRLNLDFIYLLLFLLHYLSVFVALFMFLLHYLSAFDFCGIIDVFCLQY